ncbi:telomere binding protein [Podila epigama]|nr:telomere binding protein [Podila epigama]
MSNVVESGEGISAYMADLHSQLRAPAPSMTAVMRVLAEPLHFLGLIPTNAHSQTEMASLPQWAGPGGGESVKEEEEKKNNHNSNNHHDTRLRTMRLCFIQHNLSSHLEFLLDHITVDWLSALTSAQQTLLFESYFVPPVITPRQGLAKKHPPNEQQQQQQQGQTWDYDLNSCIAAVAVQILVGRLNHRFQEQHSFLSQTILRLLRKQMLTFTLQDYHHGMCLFQRSSVRHFNSSSSSSFATSSYAEWTTSWDTFISKLYSIPTRVSNVLGMAGQLGSRRDQDLDPCFQDTLFFERQAKQLQNILGSRGDSSIAPEELSRWPYSAAVIMAKFMRLGHGGIMVKVMIASLWDESNTVAKQKSKGQGLGWRGALSHCTSGITQQVLITLVEQLQSSQLDFGDEKNAVSGNKSGDRIGTHSKFKEKPTYSSEEQLSRVHKAAKLLIHLGFGVEEEEGRDGTEDDGASNNNNDMIGLVLRQGKVYSTSVLRTLICVQTGWPKDVQASEGREVASLFAQGMSNWLDLENFQQKALGLILAEEISKVTSTVGSAADFDLDGSQPHIWFARLLVSLKDGCKPFSPVPDTVSDHHRTSVTTETQAADRKDTQSSPGQNREEMDNEEEEQQEDDDDEEDPDAIVPRTRTTVDSGSESDDDDDDDDDNDDNDEDDLQPYAMEEESDVDEDADVLQKPKVAAPIYLMDLNTYLRASEDRAKAEMGLNKAAELIRRKAGTIELNEYAEQLTRTLIQMQDTFELDGFFKNRENALVALVATSPIHASGVLTFEFYEKKNSLGQRLNILTALGLGAQELSGNSAAPPTPETGPHTPGPVTTTTSSSREKGKGLQPMTFDSITTAISMDKTRRFSNKSEIEARRAPPKANPFANLAPVFLAGLLGRWGGNRGPGKEQGFDVLQRAPVMVLKKFVLTLGIIVYYAGNSTHLVLMTRELFRFLLALRYYSPPPTMTPPPQPSRFLTADSISAMFDQATTLSTPLTSLKLPNSVQTTLSRPMGESSGLGSDGHTYNPELIEVILFNFLILTTPSNSALSDAILLAEFYPEILEIQQWAMELWEDPSEQEQQTKSRMYCAALLQRCFELVKMNF